MNFNADIIESPLTKGRARRIAEFNPADINASYLIYYAIDVSQSFSGVQRLYLYRCEESGYEFYYPFNVAGKAELYKQLSTFDWYYPSWKWEHEFSLSYLEKCNSILEIGCGSGLFLQKLKTLFPEKRIRGLEISVDENSHDFIINQKIEEYVSSSNERYDMVCCYQVLEHIADVGSFLESSVEAVKKGGYLIIGVPNNDSLFFKKRGEPILNMPPHHMGLWRKASLQFLTKQFPLKLVDEKFEPIQDYHFEWFKTTIRKRLNFPVINRILKSDKILTLIAKLLRKFFMGHTCVFVFQKI